jgi:rhomboid protease GluP
VTLAIIALNVLLYVVEVLLAGTPRAALSMSTHPRAMLAAGGNYDPFVVGEGRFELLVTSCFLHWSLLHIAFNMYALRQVGPFVEKAVGAARFAPMYLVSGILASATSAAWHWWQAPEPALSAGASGAICGVIGTALVLGGRMQGWRGPLVRSMAIWLGITIAIGYSINADNAAHIGGAVTGAVFAAVWRRGVVYTKRRANLTIAACAAVVVVAFGVLFVRVESDPYATLSVPAREARAAQAIDERRCDEAARATRRAEQVAPRSPDVATLKRQLALACPH